MMCSFTFIFTSTRRYWTGTKPVVNFHLGFLFCEFSNSNLDQFYSFIRAIHLYSLLPQCLSVSESKRLEI